jgi:hypothetical protein
MHIILLYTEYLLKKIAVLLIHFSCHVAFCHVKNTSKIQLIFIIKEEKDRERERYLERSSFLREKFFC